MRYARSRFRLVLLGLMLAVTIVITRVGNSPQPSPATNPSDTRFVPTSLFQVIMDNRDPVFFAIILCSIAGVTLIIQGFVKNRQSVVIPDATVNAIREMINQRQFKELLEFTEVDPTFVSRALNAALKRAGQKFPAMKEAMETSIGEQTAEQFRRIEYLNIIGNLGPLLGLLGTVLGMIAAFIDMYKQGGNATPDQLAYGISKVLAHTFMGLVLAIPCLASFGILRTIVDRLTVQAALVSEDLLFMIKPADAPPSVPMPRAATPIMAAPVVQLPDPI